MVPLTVAQIAERVAGVAEGDVHKVIEGVASIEDASESDLAFAANPKALAAAMKSKAGCILIPASFSDKLPTAVIRVPEPRLAFAKALEAIFPPKKPAPRVHPSAVVAASAQLGANCFVGPCACIGENARIADGCRIGAGCIVGDDFVLGRDSVLHGNVTIYDGVKIGARAMIHSGVVIGADGFGFALSSGRYEKFPQVGTVEIGDDVEIGANSCIDRAALGTTRIGHGTKLDNLVHVAHNCVLGRHVVVAAQTGFSGGVTVGDYAVIGGQAGIGEKAKIESKAVVGGKAGVLTSQTVRAGEPVWGIPARPLRGHLKNLAYMQKLPELNAEVRGLNRRLRELEVENAQARVKLGTGEK